MALGNYPQASKTALIIARQEQELGNYKAAHTFLFDTFKQMERHRVSGRVELYRSLTLLHSYVLVKILVKAGDHEGAARMLIRVAKSVSRFKNHVVPILTSTVMECQRAGLKQTALHWAGVLMRPEHRNDIPPQFKRKIESLVRKPPKEVS